jgi:hypothetical protein
MNIFEKIGLLFKTTINKWFTKLVDLVHNNAHFIHAASEIVSNINSFVQGSTADIITAIIPGTLDDTVKIMAREWLPMLIKQLHTAEDYSGLTPDQVLQKFVDALPGMSDEQRTFILHNLSSLLGFKLAEGKLSLGDVYGVIEGTYQSIVKPKLGA